jgi:hypothetical protein
VLTYLSRRDRNILPFFQETGSNKRSGRTPESGVIDVSYNLRKGAKIRSLRPIFVMDTLDSSSFITVAIFLLVGAGEKMYNLGNAISKFLIITQGTSHKNITYKYYITP